MAESRRSPGHVGINVRHARQCRVRAGGRCSCSPSYRAEVWSARDRKKIRTTCRTLAEAKAWRANAKAELRRGTPRMPDPLTLADWLDPG